MHWIFAICVVCLHNAVVCSAEGAFGSDSKCQCIELARADDDVKSRFHMEIDHSEALYEAGETQKAIDCLQGGLAWLKGIDHPAKSEFESAMRLKLAQRQLDNFEYNEANKTARKALATFLGLTHADDNIATAMCHAIIERSCYSRGDFVEAERHALILEATFTKVLNKESLEAAVARRELALIYLETPDFQKAKELLEDYHNVLEKTRPKYENLEIDRRDDFARIDMVEGRLGSARDKFKLCIDQDAAGKGEHTTETLDRLSNYATLNTHLGDPLKAEAELKEVVKLRRRPELMSTCHLARDLERLASVQIVLSKLSAAEESVDEAITLYKRLDNPASIYLAKCLRTKVAIWRRSGNRKGVDKLIEEASRIEELAAKEWANRPNAKSNAKENARGAMPSRRF